MLNGALLFSDGGSILKKIRLNIGLQLINYNPTFCCYDCNIDDYQIRLQLFEVTWKLISQRLQQWKRTDYEKGNIDIMSKWIQINIMFEKSTSIRQVKWVLRRVNLRRINYSFFFRVGYFFMGFPT